MILGLLGILLGNLAVSLGAHELLRHVRTGTPSVDFVVFLLLRLLLVSAVMLLAGLTGTLRAEILAPCAMFAVAALLLRGAHRRIPRPVAVDAGRWLAALTAVVAVRLLLQVYFFAPHMGDAVAYHLPKLAEWIRAGEFTREMGLHPHTTFPAGFELIEAWWVVFPRHDLLIEMGGVEFLALAFAGTYALARWLGWSQRTSYLAATLYLLSPGLHLGASSCLNDTAVAALVVGTAALVATRAPIPLVLTAVGLGLGVKATYGFALPGLLVMAFLVRNDPRPAFPGTAWGWIPAAAAAATGGFWYLRNAAWFGNPFHPLGTGGMMNPVAVQFGPRLSSLAANLKALILVRIDDRAGAVGANVDHIAGWGAPAFACGIVALALAVWTNVRLRTLAVGFLSSLLSLLLFVQNDPCSLKYAFFFPALLCLAGAKLSESNRAVAVLTAAGLAFSFAATLLPYDLPRGYFVKFFRQPAQTRSSLWLWDKDVPDDAVGCFGGPLARPYLLYRPDFSRQVHYLRDTDGRDLVQRMAALRIRHLYVSPATPDERSILEEAVSSGGLERAGPHLYRRRD